MLHSFNDVGNRTNRSHEGRNKTRTATPPSDRELFK